MRSMRLLVVGGGIGGLSAALALPSTPTPTHLEWSMTSRRWT
jgi:2-polyprenyl-6-methoxyphenol hydroxylase-like FAD-dependent oxidoreductase